MDVWFDVVISKIKRSEIEDPFRVDKALPLKYRHSLKDYQTYMKFGGSLGESGAVSHQFKQVGVIRIEKKKNFR